MDYIIDFKPTIIKNIDKEKISEIEYKIINRISITKEEVKYLLDYIIYLTRYKINSNLDNYEYKTTSWIYNEFNFGCAHSDFMRK